MNLSLYIPQDTWIHRLDGRTKSVGLLGLFSLALIFSDPGYLMGLAGLILVGFIMARAIPNLWRLWILLLLLFVYSVILWPFFTEGKTLLFSLGSLVVTLEGVAYGVGMGLRLDLFLLSGVLLLSTTTIEDFARSLERLGLPSIIAFALSLAFRWVPTLLGAVMTIVQAQRSRGLDLATSSFLGKLRRYPPLVVPLIGHTLRQTNLLAMALESKGFGPGQQRQPYRLSRMQRQDYLVLTLTLLVVMFCVWLRWKGYGTIHPAP